MTKIPCYREYMSNIKILLGQRIKNLRKARGITQEKLAEIISMDITTLSKIETGRNYPQPETVEKLAKAFGVRIQDMFVIDDFETPEQFISAINDNLKYINQDKMKLKIVYDVTSSIIQ